MAQPASDSSDCIGDDALFELALGKLEASAVFEAEAHLRSCAECRTVLAEVAQSLEPSRPSAAEGGGLRIARYGVLEPLGAGAWGVVYKAFDPNLRRTVALKVLRRDPDTSSNDPNARVLREAQAMAQLSHPNVVPVYDAGVHESSVYIVMEYVDGKTLAEWLAADRGLEEILRVFLAAGQGLAAAHDRGLVHRDFKPENVLVSSSGIAKVTDFGLARMAAVPAQDPKLDGSEPLTTQTRGLVGTPVYMAPELFEGTAADAASDQFSFCVALYAALTGQHPFCADQGIAFAELLLRVKSGVCEPVPPERPLPEHVLCALRRGLSPAPEARFASMHKLLAALGPPRLSRKAALLMLAGVAALIPATLVAVKLVSTPKSVPAPAASVVVTQPVPTAAAPPPPEVVAPAPAHTAPRVPASSSAAKPRPPARRPSTPAPDVRYRDGLKDPF